MTAFSDEHLVDVERPPPPFTAHQNVPKFIWSTFMMPPHAVFIEKPWVEGYALPSIRFKKTGFLKRSSGQC